MHETICAPLLQLRIGQPLSGEDILSNLTVYPKT